ncbi:hypothetical protein EIP91_009700 [Steccherinum ochraceum]|uniref:Rho-GAP domain-containing protein n=1 Tax=Steccherinum ochraceum TaxID=92696 RepID=A0A4R0RNZ5_9APHY|nr:hypothetical protein EIP91_009700 [Steccherinum ochraceum]
MASQEPQTPRASTSDIPDSPVALFDSHLRILNDSYITFFQERRRIEEIYVDSLIKLHKKAKSIDLYLDSRSESTSARGAWTEIRENIEREADTRVAFISTLSTEVLNPLLSLKETQERIRKRIREDLKDAITAHADYSENVYPKLKRAYLKKSQDVEDLKTAAAQLPPLSPSATMENHHPFSNVKTNNPPPSRPIVTAPQPLRPLERRASGTIPVTRNRSPSSSSALQDLAHQGKKHMNQLMTFLDKNNVKDTLSGRSDTALRSVRAKREADDADKEYRKAVHWLETLRIRRVKLLESGYNSVEMFVRESAETVKQVLERYTNNLGATLVSQAQLCEHARRISEKISPQQDAIVLTARIPRMLSAAMPKPIYYYNYHVGECPDLVFGVTLVDYATSRGLPDGEIPKIVKICIQEIEERGMNTEGIYRVSGRHAAVLDLQHKIERNEAAFTFHAPHDDVYAISSLLKLYLRELPDPVFRFPMQDRIQHTDAIDEHLQSGFQLLRSKIRRLPPIHQATLKAIVEHLSRVAARADKNKMDARNLAISFGTVIFGEDEMPKGSNDLLSVQSWKDTLMEDLITHAPVLFQPTNQSPPLPPAPLGESPPTVQYGSAHTRVAKVGAPSPRSPSPRSQDPYVIRTAQSEGHGQSETPSDDFAPQMPTHPANSIHPSLRSGPMSASPARQSLPPPSRAAQYFEEHIPYAQYATAPQSATLPLPPGARPPSPQNRDPGAPLMSPWSDGSSMPTPPLTSRSMSQGTTTPQSSTRSISQGSRTPPTTVNDGPTSLGSSPAESLKRAESNGTTASPIRTVPPPLNLSTPASDMSSSSGSSTETTVPNPTVEPPTPLTRKPSPPLPQPPSPTATSESDAGTVDSYQDAWRGSFMSSVD